MLNGKSLYDIGVNYYNLFVSAFLREWDTALSRRAMQTMKDYGCKVICFSTLLFCERVQLF